MIQPVDAVAGQFCWLDLAATDAHRAKRFYGQMFGWDAREYSANGGSISRLQRAGQNVGSLYQLSPAHLQGGVPSHWTPYVRVGDLAAAVQRAVACGGSVVVEPFAVTGTARIALIQDAVGALIGLWEPFAVRVEEDTNG